MDAFDGLLPATKLWFREHEVGPRHPRMRVWTQEMVGYGQFNVLSHEQFEKLKQLCAQSKIQLIDADLEDIA